MHAEHPHEADSPTSPAEYWEARYQESEQIWSGHANNVLEDVAARLQPGRALDLGCGEGADAIWLASHGWHATGVDLSETAVGRARKTAATAGIDASRIEFIADDLETWNAPVEYDLVSASFLHSSSAPLAREAILRRGASVVTPGGRLLVTSHAAPPPWADATHGHREFPTPESDLAALEIEPAHWHVEISECRERQATSPDGQAATLIDGVLLVRRLQ